MLVPQCSFDTFLSVQNGVDSVVGGLNELKAACRSAKAYSRGACVPSGAGRAVIVTLLNSIGSWSCVKASLQCLHVICTGSNNPAVTMRQDGGLRACTLILKRFGKRAEAVQMCCRLLHRALISSALTAASMLKV
jgi:hypothetical protein